MHYLVFVVTTEKPTKELLTKTLEPFRQSVENPDGHLDWFALGGRYTGNIMACPHQADSTITAGLTRPDFETALDAHHELYSFGTELKHPGKTGPGVDAAQIKHIHDLLVRPAAVVVNGQWHNSPDAPELQARGIFRKLSVDTGEEWETENAGKCDEQLAAYKAWLARMVSEVLEPRDPNDWLSVVDCHN